MSRHDFEIPLLFQHRILFTRAVFAADNPALAELLRAGGGARALVVIEEAVAAAWPELESAVAGYFRGLEVELCSVLRFPGGEAVKADAAMAGKMWEEMDRCRLDRHSYLLAIGGGAFLDVAGFAAATAHRGVCLLRFPTTTLAQGDSGVGVKCGINHFDKKNWLGSFAVPFAVVNDLDFLDSLAPAVSREGLVEAVKVALVKDRGFFEWIEANLAALGALERGVVAECVERSALLHARHIAFGGDPFETGSSRPLDYGHWAAHKLEAMTGYELSHGAAVAVGLALDTLYSVACGMLAEDAGKRVLAVLRGLGLAVWHPALDWKDAAGRRQALAGLDEFREHMGGRLTVLMLRELGKGEDVHRLDEGLLEECVLRLKEGKLPSVRPA